MCTLLTTMLDRICPENVCLCRGCLLLYFVYTYRDNEFGVSLYRKLKCTITQKLYINKDAIYSIS